VTHLVEVEIGEAFAELGFVALVEAADYEPDASRGCASIAEERLCDCGVNSSLGGGCRWARKGE
jgi:hypothetical protein